MSAAEAADEAQRFARYGIHGGKGAAALQRPADPSGYARGVDAYLAQARQLLAQYGSGAAGAQQPGQRPATTTPPVGVSPTPTIATPPVAFNLPPTAFNQGIQNLQGAADVLAQRTGTVAPQIPRPAIPQFPAPVVPPAPTSTVEVPLNTRGANGGGRQGPDAQASHIVQLARKYLGTPYVWGGTTPKGFDCSGFVQYLYAQQGVKLPRVAADQFRTGQHVDLQHLQPGDAVFFRDSTGIHHEGLYIGGGRFIHAPHTGDHVKISSLSDTYYAQQFAGGRRYG